jgi:hypothetical protein
VQWWTFARDAIFLEESPESRRERMEFFLLSGSHFIPFERYFRRVFKRKRIGIKV